MSGSTPRSIDDYLTALRASLAGEDPAVIQDALYDAEAHLRAEAAANPGKPEADVLERVVDTYGRPEEIAAAYRDAEVKVAHAFQVPRATSPRGPLKRFFSVYSDPHAYTSLFFMFMSLVTGIVYFTFAVTGLALSAGLAILIFGLLVFVAFIGIARVIALAEGRLLEAVSGERMPRRPVHPGPRGSMWERIRDMLQDARTWTTLVYLVLMLPLGIIYFTLATTALSLGVSLTFVPIIGIGNRLDWWAEWGIDRLDMHPMWFDTPGGWVFCVVMGPVVLTALLHFARAVIGLHARTAKALLVT
jgi:hypothetical protein